MHNSRRIHRIATSLSHGGIVGGAVVYHEQTHQTHRSDCRAAAIISDKDNDNNKEITIVNNKCNDEVPSSSSSAAAATTTTSTSLPNELYAYDELSLYEIFSDRAPSDKEIEAATNTLLENDDNLFERLIPGMGSSIKKETIKYIKNLNFNELANKTRDEIIKVENESVSRSVSPTTFKQLGSQMASSWESLREDYPCCICQDVLAAPVLMEPCSHSFCGECMEEFWTIKKGVPTTSSSAAATTSTWSFMSSPFVSSIANFFQVDSDDEEVDSIRFTCPECREEILNKTGIFNKILDRDIARRVAEIKDCDAKREWTTRRNSYISRNKMKVKKSNTKKVAVDEDNIRSYEQVFDKFIPLIAITIMAIIYLCRRK